MPYSAYRKVESQKKKPKHTPGHNTWDMSDAGCRGKVEGQTKKWLMAFRKHAYGF